VGNKSKQIQCPNIYWRINDDSHEIQLKNPNGEDTVKDKESFEFTQCRTAQISSGRSENGHVTKIESIEI
jgi:hypothetical protein